ncbi:MAG: sulfotransferase [Chloroflexi bacterium]|nr:sulfotransferase [Chloroflexota bacterium]
MHRVTTPGPFFVGGTGRSGTTHLRNVLGQHPAVYALPDETRFLIDPGGLEDLAHALTGAYTPFHAEDALRRFDRLMRVTLTSQSQAPFRGRDLPSMLGASRYWAALDRLREQLVWYAFDEGIADDGRMPPLSPYEPSVHHRIVPRYFDDRPILIAILRGFVEELFGGATAAQGKLTWCEKTPFNVLSAPFLWELVPEATVVHIMRHPVAVVASHLHQPWAPDELWQVVAWLTPIYTRWFRIRDALDLEHTRLVEVRLEDLAEDWPRQRRLLFEALGLDDVETPSGFERPAVRHRDSQLSADERTFVVSELGWAIERLGYSPSP